MSDNEHAILNLSPDEKRAFSFLFNQADKDQLGVVTGENAVSFFERTHVSPNVLGEIWQLADTENRGFLSQPGFCMVLRLIGHYQAGREPTSELAFKSAPVPKFEGLQIPGVGAGAGAASGTGSAGGSAIPSPTTGSFPPNPLQPQLSGQAPIRVPPLDPQKVQQYSSLFERSGSQNGQLDGATAKAIFERAGLPNDVLGRIWNLADRDQKGALDQTEFIVAMHLLTSMKTRAMSALPQTLPPGFYEAAARRGAPPSRQASGQVPVPRQTTGGAVGAIPRTQSPLARPAGYGTPPPMSAQTSGTPWLITAADKAKFDQFFNTIDTQGRGVITGEQAVTFFSDSRLSEETLAQIWDLADINSEGQLNKDEFAVAMYLIRQQRASNAAPLPAFLPPPLVPPSMRKQQPQPQQSTAPAFDNAANTSNLPKSAADDLFGLDQPSQSQAPALQPQGTGASAAKDPFSGGSPASPSSPARFQPQPQQAGSMFKPFQPTSAFGASIAQQNTGTSVGSNQPRSVPQQAAPTAADDLLGDNETHAAESSKLTNETTELANMSNQIGNLRTQMEQTQAKKSTNQADLTATNNQKRDLELRLQQFRTQYEQEVKTVKELDQQLVESRESTKKLGQELAMLEGTYQDLQTQHQNVSQALQADQQENASLKQRIAQINTEVASLKPEIEKLKMDARQQKGLVSINKKQLATNEGEKEKLQSEKADLEREAAEREAQARAAPAPEPVVSPPAAASTVASPGGTLHSSNPFFRKASNDGARGSPPPTGTGSGPKPSAFDALFGPSAAFAPTGQASSRTGTPPATSFIGRSVPAAAAGAAVGAATAVGMSDSIQSVSSVGEPTPSATPPLSEQAKESPQAAEPPPPPESRQFTASHLPVGNVDGSREEDASSTRVLPPASRAGLETPQDTISSAGDTATPPQVHGQFLEDPKPETAAQEGMPGAFPSETFQSTNATPVPTHLETAPAVKDDFDSAFAGFGEGDKAKDAAKENEDPFGASSSQAAPQVSASEFPPIQTLEPEDDESDSEDEGKGFDDNFTAASPPRNQTATSSVQPPTEPPQYTSALAGASSSPPSYDDSDKAAYGGSGERIEENKFDPKFGGLLPAREDPTSPPPPDEGPIASATTTELPPEPSTSARQNAFHTPTTSTAQPAVSAQPKNAFDDFDAFDDLAEAKEADKTGDFDFGEHNTEFNPTFDSPAASMTNTMTSTQQTPVAASRSLNQPESNGFANFQPSLSTSNTFGSTSSVANSSIQQTPENVQHDWDAIFSGLDNSKNVDTTLTTDPWGPSDATNTNGTSSLSAPAAPAPSSTTRPPTIENFPHPPPPAPASKAERGGAITPGTEHDDPILKRLTGMGYPRKDALDALEKYDYDINKAVDHLTSS